MRVVTLERVDSTNNYVKQHWRELEDLTLVRSVEQESGRGQRGNSWESAPGENLTVSMLHFPQGLAANRQFRICEAVSLGVRDFLCEKGIDAMIKWPNDIYVGEKKICGILIENSLNDRLIGHTVIGIGLNVNQLQFLSDAPNPVSMKMISGITYDLEEAAEDLGRAVARRLEMLKRGDDLHGEYKERLWRREGYHWYRERENGVGAVPAYGNFAGEEGDFLGKIVDVAEDGMLQLERLNGDRKDYFFKEIEFLRRES